MCFCYIGRLTIQRRQLAFPQSLYSSLYSLSDRVLRISRSSEMSTAVNLSGEEFMFIILIASCSFSFQGTIITLEDFGMLVKLADHIRGLCPKLHLADIILKHPEKKLKDGKQVKCRVSDAPSEYSSNYSKNVCSALSLKCFAGQR